MTSELHECALALASRGVPIFPCQPRGKEPVTSNGCKAATTNTVAIDRWWTAAPDMNIGIATGEVAGFFVVDVDGQEGEASLRDLEVANGELPPTVEVITGRGRHLYFRIGEHEMPRNSAGAIGVGIDTRGTGGYVMAPPSVHPSGRKYEWSVDCADRFADAPDWLHEKLAETSSGKGRPLEEWHATLTKPIPNGQRNDTLASVAGKLIHSNVNLVLVHDLVSAVNIARCDPPLEPSEVERLVVSVAQSHLRNHADGR